uniref:Uncharacterized protein n=1 Tax=Globodera pallida TaxID=36090 RepID=A0A183BMB6_GLOPA
MTDVADTLHGQNDEIEPTNDKESTADQQGEEQKKGMKQQLKGEESAKMEEFQKQQQHNIDESAQRWRSFRNNATQH